MHFKYIINGHLIISVTGLSNTGEIRALMINSDQWRAAIRDSRVDVG